MLDDIYFMKQALIEAGKAAERGEVPVGAVVVCKDRNIRIAPSLPPVAELEQAMGVFCVCLKMAALEQALA